MIYGFGVAAARQILTCQANPFASEVRIVVHPTVTGLSVNVRIYVLSASANSVPANGRGHEGPVM